jgi:hypothetical protein
MASSGRIKKIIIGNEPFIDLAYFESYIVPAIYKAFE